MRDISRRGGKGGGLKGERCKLMGVVGLVEGRSVITTLLVPNVRILTGFPDLQRVSLCPLIEHTP